MWGSQHSIQRLMWLTALVSVCLAVARWHWTAGVFAGCILGIAALWTLDIIRRCASVGSSPSARQRGGVFLGAPVVASTTVAAALLAFAVVGMVCWFFPTVSRSPQTRTRNSVLGLLFAAWFAYGVAGRVKERLWPRIGQATDDSETDPADPPKC